MSALIILKWQDEQGRPQEFRLINKVCSRWKQFGTKLGFETAELEALDAQYHRDASVCWIRVIDRFLNKGSVVYPSTWDGLNSLLKDVGFADTAKELEKALPSRVSNFRIDSASIPVTYRGI